MPNDQDQIPFLRRAIVLEEERNRTLEKQKGQLMCNVHSMFLNSLKIATDLCQMMIDSKDSEYREFPEDGRNALNELIMKFNKLVS